MESIKSLWNVDDGFFDLPCIEYRLNIVFITIEVPTVTLLISAVHHGPREPFPSCFWNHATSPPDCKLVAFQYQDFDNYVIYSIVGSIAKYILTVINLFIDHLESKNQSWP